MQSIAKRRRGFTLIELVIALAVMAVLLTMAAPMLKLQAQREREAELRTALREIRGALDAYRAAAADGRIRLPADASGYPASLALLVDGVADARRPDGAPIRFLRRLPRDPLHPDLTVPAADTWGQRSYASPADAPEPGDDVFDVHSLSERTGSNGVPYRQW
jgi:general secretion pathway protein G